MTNLENMTDDNLQSTKQDIVAGITDSPKRGFHTLSDLARPLPTTLSPQRFSRAVDALVEEKVLSTQPSATGVKYDYHHAEAVRRQYA